MTTIAYKDGVIAADGRLTMGGTILTDDCDKSHRMHGGVLFACGVGHAAELLAELPEFRNDVPCDETEWQAIFVRDGKVYLCGNGDDRLWLMEWKQADGLSIGSGSDSAMTAMDMGCSPWQAVELASKRDTSTGGTIREWNIGDL